MVGATACGGQPSSSDGSEPSVRCASTGGTRSNQAGASGMPVWPTASGPTRAVAVVNHDPRIAEHDMRARLRPRRGVPRSQRGDVSAEDHERDQPGVEQGRHHGTLAAFDRQPDNAVAMQQDDQLAQPAAEYFTVTRSTGAPVSSTTQTACSNQDQSAPAYPTGPWSKGIGGRGPRGEAASAPSRPVTAAPQLTGRVGAAMNPG